MASGVAGLPGFAVEDICAVRISVETVPSARDVISRRTARPVRQRIAMRVLIGGGGDQKLRA